MSVTRESFGFMPDNTEIFKYIIENACGTEVHVITLGATLQSLLFADKNGVKRDVLLGFDTVEDYLEKSNYQGATVGPFCNRIGGAAIDIGGKHYELVANEKGVTSLHSNGEFSFRPWKAIVPDADCVELSYLSPDGEGGFPGETKVQVLFRLSQDNKLSIRYHGVSTRDTFLNFTNHAYFNLNGYDAGDILGHTLRLNADEFTPVDEYSIPTGGNLPVEGTPFDFRTAKPIGLEIEADHVQLKMTGGYDHNFALADGPRELTEIGEAAAPESGIKMNIYTTLPAVQFYAGNFLNGKTGKQGKPMEKRSGFCLETQYFPDSPHHPEFPSCLFKAGEEYESETVYGFGLI